MERKECGGGCGGVECDCRETRADATVWWSTSESSVIENGHSRECLARMW